MEINRKVHRFVKGCAIRTNLRVAPMKKLLRKDELQAAIKARTRLVRFPVTFRAVFQVTKKKRKEKYEGNYLNYVRLSGRQKEGRKEGKRKREAQSRNFFRRLEKRFDLNLDRLKNVDCYE